MRAISLWQPWASLWCINPRVKLHETRHFATSYRGWLVVQAAKRRIDDFDGDDLDDICSSAFGSHWAADLPRGALVGAVHLVDCIPTDRIVFNPENEAHADNYKCGDFSAGRYGWLADRTVLFPRPIPYLGRQGFFSVPDEIVQPLMQAA
jgi:hypothetical protein